MDPMTAISLAQGVYGIGQKIAEGIKRRRAEKEFAKHPYEIPSGARAALENTQQLATLRSLPGEDIARRRMLGNVAGGVEAATKAASSPSDVLGVLGKLYGDSYVRFEENMAQKGAQMFLNNQQNLNNMLGKFAGYEDEKWRYNHLYPYMQKMGAASAMGAAGNMNIGSALKSGMQIFAGKEAMKENQNYYDKFLKDRTILPGGQVPLSSTIAPIAPAQPVPTYGYGAQGYDGEYNPYNF